MDLTSRLSAPCGVALLLAACAEEPPTPPPAPPCAGAGVESLVGDWVATSGARVDLTTRLRITRQDAGLSLQWVRGSARAALTAPAGGPGFEATLDGQPFVGQLHPERCTLVVRAGEAAPVELLPSLKGDAVPWATCTEAAELRAEGDRAVLSATAQAPLPEGCVGEAALYLDERRVDGALTIDGPRWSVEVAAAAPGKAELHRASRCGEAPPTPLGVACVGHDAPSAVQ
ncbi:hypothetical protein L6R49_27980 [Myxococcota bacterium]|nr:hypothetical protein [Myxococcota bacterium]